MFRQIWIHPDDQVLQKIIWRNNPNQMLREYQLTTVTYGTKAAPFLAMVTLKQIANDERGNYPEASKVIEESFYMDDLVHGAHTIAEAKKLHQDLIALLKSGGFNLRKWSSNDPNLAHTENQQELKSFKQAESTNTLGLKWNHGEVHTKSKILNLNPFLDKDGILRVRGRLRNAQISNDTKHPIILPHSERLTELVIDDAYSTMLHGGARMTLSFIRKKYWITGGNRATKAQIRRCVKCAKHNPEFKAQIMGDLPVARSNPSRPFAHTGVDYTGHIYVKASKGHGIKRTKGYVAVFVCMATKAVHLELVSDLSTSTFIAALRRMAARKGTPKHMYSDNGGNFVGANNFLQKEYQEIQKAFESNEVRAELLQMEIQWNFNAPLWPSAGGIWEASVKCFKNLFKKVVGEQLLTYEELYTILAQIEGCLNSRQLCAISEDPDEMDYLTPAHFLTGESSVTLYETETDLRTRWQLTQKIVRVLWKRWKNEYLTQVTGRSKWRQAKANISLNDVVIIHEANLPSGKWLMGRVIGLHPASDGYVRVVTLKTQNGILKRPITKVSILPVQNQAKQSDPLPPTRATS